MSREWYYAIDNRQLGPVSASDITSMLKRGQLNSQHRVWTRGMKAWGSIGSVAEFAVVAAESRPKPGAAEGQEHISDNPFAAPMTDIRTEHRRRGRIREYAGFWKRVVAMILDTVLLIMVNFAILFIATQVVNSRNFATVMAVSLAMNFGIQWLYFAGMESSTRQATLGKSAIGIKVTDMRGRPISFRRATGRLLAKLMFGLVGNVLVELDYVVVGAVFLVVGLIGYLMVAFTDEKRGLHDMLAGTLVVESD